VALVRQLVFDGLSAEQVASLESFVRRVLSRLTGPECELRVRVQRPAETRPPP
jgi:hypothetical protein